MNFVQSFAIALLLCTSTVQISHAASDNDATTVETSEIEQNSRNEKIEKLEQKASEVVHQMNLVKGKFDIGGLASSVAGAASGVLSGAGAPKATPANKESKHT